jgi:pyruvate dehydrogenase E1 component alpha subunit
MEYTPIGDVTPVANPAADRAAAYRLPAEILDGNDVVMVRDAVTRAADRARSGNGPTVLEAKTYRHFGHSRTDPGSYRPADEVERWLRRDPLDLAKARLEALGVTAESVAAVDSRVDGIVKDAVAAAKAAPGPDPADAMTDVWADGGSAWRT